jgi:ribosomal protein S18 acetylase RimI-like enzyme
MASLTISEIGIDRLDEIAELWLALHRYHGEIGSRPLVADEAAAWRWRRALYERWLRAGEAFALLAEREGRPAGYAVVHLQEGPDDTFPLGERWAEIYSLAVAPAERGQGIGSRLLDTVDARLDVLGIRDVAVAAMVENEAALRLYERRGFVRREVILYRFAGHERE